jgi:hypothetical protein
MVIILFDLGALMGIDRILKRQSVQVELLTDTNYQVAVAKFCDIDPDYRMFVSEFINVFVVGIKFFNKSVGSKGQNIDLRLPGVLRRSDQPGC